MRQLKRVDGHQTILAYSKERPYGLLLYTAIALSLALGFLPITNFDFQGKTMFDVPLDILVWIIPLILIFFWLLYLKTKRFLYSRAIIWTHVLITVSTTIFIVIILYIVFTPWQPASHGNSSVASQELIGNATRIVFILFVLGQFAYIVNALLRLLQRRNNA